MAHLALSVQIGDDGVVRAADRVAYRPALRGGFLSYWNSDRRYLKPTGVVQAVADRFNMPAEYLGVRPTDSETSFDAYAFLVLYRCARYQVGCKLVGAAVPPPRTTSGQAGHRAGWTGAWGRRSGTWTMGTRLSIQSRSGSADCSRGCPSAPPGSGASSSAFTTSCRGAAPGR